MGDPALPERLGKYEVVGRLAFGGMAEVLLGRLTGADGFSRQVVIKRVLTQHLANHEFLTMFRDEARITANLYHGNIVQVVEFGEVDGQYYLVLEHVDGASLGTALTELQKTNERLSVAEAMHITVEVARALDYAHNKLDAQGESLSIVHRDVTPSNILLSKEGVVKLADFGIAKARARLSPTQGGVGVLKGKLSYMAPETVLVGRTDARSDLFALGAVLWEMLVGKSAFAGDNEAMTLQRVTLETPHPPSSFNRGVPEELDRLVMQLLSRDRDKRPARGLEVAHALNRITLGPAEESEAPPVELLARTVARISGDQGLRTRETARPTRVPRVLVVDESRTFRALLRARLGDRYRVIDASSVEEARKLAKDDAPDAVMCQRSLRGSSGLKFLRWMREDRRLSGVPFLLLTSEVTTELRSETRVAGGQGVISKSLGAAELDILDQLTQR
jgi:serine/threonine protein kinase